MEPPPDVQGNRPLATDLALDRRAVALARAQEEWRQLGLHVRTITPRALDRFLLVITALTLIVWLLVTGSSALFWFSIGAVLAYLLLPVINGAERWMPRWAAIILAYLGGIILLVVLMILIVPPLLNQLGTALHSLSDSKSVQDLVKWVDGYIATLPPDLQTFINDTIKASAATIKKDLIALVYSIAAVILSLATKLLNLVGFLFGFIVVPFWVFYVVRDQQNGKRAIDRLLPTWLRLDFWAIVRIVDGVFGSWIRGQLFLSSVLGVEIFLGLNLLKLLGVQGIHYIVLLAAIAFVTSPIPYIANYLAFIPALFMGLQTSIETALAIGVVYIISQNVQDNLLSPRINGQALNIHPAILMPTIVVLARFGLLWLILAGPIAAVSRELFLYVYGRFQDPPRPAGVLPRAYGSAPAQSVATSQIGQVVLPAASGTGDSPGGAQGESAAL